MSYSPWGKIQEVEKISAGFSFVSTPGHGGLRISINKAKKELINCDLVVQLAGIVQGNYVFFEEDCAYALLLCDAPQLLIEFAKVYGNNPDELFKQVKATSEKWFPDYFKD